MNAKVKIGIVEDELLIAEKIKMLLLDMGYQTCTVASSYGEAIQMISEEDPDLVLLDIQLAGEKDGIDVAMYLRQHHQRPFIFLTANSDWSTVERAKQVRPAAYIVKPFTKDDLFTSIEIALANYNPPIENATTYKQERDFIFIKEGYTFKKLMYSEIRFVESDGNYANIFTEGNKKVMVRIKLDDLAKKLNTEELIRVHRSYLVNVNHINGITPTDIDMGGTQIPIGKPYKEELFVLLGIE